MNVDQSHSTLTSMAAEPGPKFSPDAGVLDAEDRFVAGARSVCYLVARGAGERPLNTRPVRPPMGIDQDEAGAELFSVSCFAISLRARSMGQLAKT